MYTYKTKVLQTDKINSGNYLTGEQRKETEALVERSEEVLQNAEILQALKNFRKAIS
jgi:hypothetical protein